MGTGVANGTRSARSRALTVLARIIGKKRGVNIVFRSGVEASTDGKTIFLPELSDVATEADAILLEGLMDHEAMHCRFTDFAFMHHPDQKAIFKTHPLMFPLFNTLEDVWGEREQAKIYPGCFQSIKRSVNEMINRNLYGGRLGMPNTPGDSLRGFVLHALLGRLYENSTLIKFGEEHKEGLISHVGQKLTDEIWAAALDVDHVTSTQQALALARRIFALIESELEPLNENSPRRKMLEDLLQSSPSGGDMATIIQQALQLNGAVSPNKSPDPVDVYELNARHLIGTPSDIAALARPIAVQLGSKLETLLESMIDEGISHGKSGKRISSKRLSGINVGRTSVFRREEEVEGLNTAIEVALDLSSSMYPDWDVLPSHPHVIAKAAIYSIGEILERYDIPFSMVAYGQHLFKLKTYDQKWRQRKNLIDVDRLGGTSTKDALTYCADSICVRSERKRMVILVTDGESDDNYGAVSVMNELSALNIEFTAVFVGKRGLNLERLMCDAGYPVSRAAAASDLPVALMQAIKTAF